MTEPTWPPDRVAALERLWTDGLSASEIAARFPGVTRNAVLGNSTAWGGWAGDAPRPRPRSPERRR
jgi:GcrA cell cycle regulator